MEPEQAVTVEVDPLIPNGIENFVPSCVVCQSPVPKKRATSRSKDTCGKACHAVLRKYRRYVLLSSRCPACFHPSTPEERKEFIQWRKWRGDRREKRGRPPKSNEEALRLALQEAIGLLRNAIDLDISVFEQTPPPPSGVAVATQPNSTQPATSTPPANNEWDESNPDMYQQVVKFGTDVLSGAGAGVSRLVGAAEWQDAVSRFEKLIDSAGEKQSTLAPSDSGQSAQGENLNE